MKHTRWVAIAAAATAVVLGGGAAVAAVGSSNPASDFLGDVAKRLGMAGLYPAVRAARLSPTDALRTV